MSEEHIRAQVDRTAALGPDAQKRVAAALKTSVEAELANRIGAAADAGAQFSRGIFFSRQSAAGLDTEQVILPQLAEMDDQRFESFAQRLSTLRNLRG